MKGFKCPKCGATPDKHGKGTCETVRAGFPSDCGGFICECEGEGTTKHGESVNDPCHNARCFHCRWAGTVPTEKAEDPIKLLRKAYTAMKACVDCSGMEPGLMDDIKKRLKQR